MGAPFAGNAKVVNGVSALTPATDIENAAAAVKPVKSLLLETSPLREEAEGAICLTRKRADIFDNIFIVPTTCFRRP